MAKKTMPKTIGYLRVSTIDQDLEKNKADILFLANNKDLGKVNFVEEKVSGKVPWRKRKIAPVLEELNKGDNIVVSELSRLGRSMLECMEILSIATHKGINIYAVKGDWQLSNSIQSKIIAIPIWPLPSFPKAYDPPRTASTLVWCGSPPPGPFRGFTGTPETAFSVAESRETALSQSRGR